MKGDKIVEKKTINYNNEQEKKLLEIIREVDYGEIKVIINNGKPIRIEELKKSIKL